MSTCDHEPDLGDVMIIAWVILCLCAIISMCSDEYHPPDPPYAHKYGVDGRPPMRDDFTRP